MYGCGLVTSGVRMPPNGALSVVVPANVGSEGHFPVSVLQGLTRWNLESVSVANFLGQSKWKAEAIIQVSEVNVCFSDPNTWKTTSTILFDLTLMIWTHLSACISESLFWMSSHMRVCVRRVEVVSCVCTRASVWLCVCTMCNSLICSS